MMATMQVPCSTKLKSFNVSLVHNGERKLSYVIASATVTRKHTSYQAKKSFQLISVNTTYKPIFQELPPLSKTLFDLDKEVDIIVERLKIAVDKLVEIEINKFMDRVKAETLSNKDNLLVDEMRKEIARQYLEKPIRYLKSGSCKVNFEQKIKDVSFLVNLLEGSLLARSISLEDCRLSKLPIS